MKKSIASPYTKLSAIGMAAYLAATGSSLAQAEGTPFVSLQNILEAGGWTLRAIILLSIVALFLIVFFLLTFRSNILSPRTFLEEAGRAAEEGDQDRLQAICANHPSPVALTIAAAARQVADSGRFDYFAVRDAVEDEGGRQAGTLWQRLQYLMDIAIVAPMVGLLGTVLGMLQSFADLQTEIGGVNPETLSQGVAMALITTAGGLIVGIAAMIVYALFRGRLNSLVAEMEENCNRILGVFAKSQGKNGETNK